MAVMLRSLLVLCPMTLDTVETIDELAKTTA